MASLIGVGGIGGIVLFVGEDEGEGVTGLGYPGKSGVGGESQGYLTRGIGTSLLGNLFDLYMKFS